MTYDMLRTSFAKELEKDVSHAISKGFTKLDLNDNNRLVVKSLRQGILVNLRTITSKSSIKDLNRAFFTKLSKMGTRDEMPLI